MKRILEWANGSPPTDTHYRKRRQEIKQKMPSYKRKDALELLRKEWIEYHAKFGSTYANQRKGNQSE